MAEMQFIDTESGHVNQKNTYEELIMMQIKNCMEVLNKEVRGGHSKLDRHNQVVYVEDVRELIINNVDTLKKLLVPFVKGEHKDIEKIEKAIKTKRESLGKKKEYIKGQGKVEVNKLTRIDHNSPIWKEYIDYKAEKHRELFQVLLMIYEGKKALIASYEVD